MDGNHCGRGTPLAVEPYSMLMLPILFELFAEGAAILLDALTLPVRALYLDRPRHSTTKPFCGSNESFGSYLLSPGT